MTNSLIQVLQDIIEKKMNTKDVVVDGKELVISKEKDIPVINLGKLSY